MGFPIVGVVNDVFVTPASRVTKGMVLAGLICDDRIANVAVAEAALADARAQLAKLNSGAREEERSIATSKVQVADADVRSTNNVFTRYDALRTKSATGPMIAEIQVETAADAMKAAQARRALAEAQMSLTNAPARREDAAIAEARRASAQAGVQLAKAEADKCMLRAPSNATVLKVNIERGDVISVTPPLIAITLGDLAKPRVRAEVDERFVERIKAGQPVTITSEFNSKLRLSGKVGAREAQMGRRTVLGVDPADKNDRDVLEILIDFDKKDAEAASMLPVGYRVTVVF
jgi:HlyD family secretion protein